jgi:hypothetical protein
MQQIIIFEGQFKLLEHQKVCRTAQHGQLSVPLQTMHQSGTTAQSEAGSDFLICMLISFPAYEHPYRAYCDSMAEAVARPRNTSLLSGDLQSFGGPPVCLILEALQASPLEGTACTASVAIYHVHREI